MSATINFPIVFSLSVNEPIIKENSGKILSVDTIASILVIRIPSDRTGENYIDIKLAVNDETLITSQDSSLGIADLKLSANVDVVYILTADGKNIAKSIMVR
jgi:hypothetical protein